MTAQRKRRQYDVCHCPVYPFPHRRAGGKCRVGIDYCEHGVDYSEDCRECAANIAHSKAFGYGDYYYD